MTNSKSMTPSAILSRLQSHAFQVMTYEGRMPGPRQTFSPILAMDALCTDDDELKAVTFGWMMIDGGIFSIDDIRRIGVTPRIESALSLLATDTKCDESKRRLVAANPDAARAFATAAAVWGDPLYRQVRSITVGGNPTLIFTRAVGETRRVIKTGALAELSIGYSVPADYAIAALAHLLDQTVPLEEGTH